MKQSLVPDTLPANIYNATCFIMIGGALQSHHGLQCLLAPKQGDRRDPGGYKQQF